MRNRKAQGFTLIELLIVIAIIGILAAVLIPNLLAARTRAFDTAAQSCARSIATAQEIYAIDNNGDYETAFPGALDAGVISGCGDGADPIVVTPGEWDGTDPWTVSHLRGSGAVYEVDGTGIVVQ